MIEYIVCCKLPWQRMFYAMGEEGQVFKINEARIFKREYEAEAWMRNLQRVNKEEVEFTLKYRPNSSGNFNKVRARYYVRAK